VKISEIAKKANVSSMVVSRVISGSPNVKTRDKKRVEDAIKNMKLNAFVDPAIKRKTGKVFGLIVPRFEDIFHSFYATEIIKGVVLAASRLKIDIMIHISERDRHEDWLTSSALSPEYIDGILFADINSDRTQLKKVLARKAPCMVLNNSFEKEPVNSIAIDNEAAAIEVTRYLIGLGHKRIATIAGDPLTDSGKKRLEGFKLAIKESGKRLNQRYITTGHYLRSPARKAMQSLLSLPESPTAVFCASDVMAMEAIDVAKSKGLSIPEDISIVGFDDNPLCAYSPIPLTTVWQPITEMGRLGVELLYQIVTGAKNQPVKTLLKTKLIQRKSCTTA
jgi:LacI family transcriptional regulator